MAVKKRCNFCRKYLRADGTCQNQQCPRYVSEPQPEPVEEQAEKPATDTNVGGK